MNIVRKLARHAWAAARARLAKVDSKVLAGTVSAVIAGAIADVGLNVNDPVIVAAISVAASAIVGVIVPNAGSGLPDRWTPATQRGASAVDEGTIADIR